MIPRPSTAPRRGVATGIAAMLVIAGCGGSPPAPAPSAAAPTDATTAALPADAGATPAAAASAAQPLAATAATWTPEALEDLLAPVALYPDPVLAQLLVAVTNPQEVLDAGNWLIANPNLSGGALDDAAEKIGFTLPMRSIMQFPEVVDQLCLNMGWTEELGQAYVNDQVGVMDAVQRLRVQAKDVGNLKTSKEMKVETVKQEGKEVVTVAPAQPQVVYVPQYDPVAAYAPAGTTITTAPGGTTNVTVNQGTAAAPATTTTTTTTQKDNTGSLIATGLLAFGAGMLVNEVFDDDEDDYWGSSYYGGMYYRPPPPYPPYPYRPSYGNGYYPNNGYNRPPTYVRGGNTVVVNQNNNYYNRYGNDASVQRNRAQPQSPITAARPQRTDLNSLNARAAAGPSRRAEPPPASWKGQSGYAGADPKARAAAGKPAAGTTATAKARTAPKAQGGYAGVQSPQQRERPASATSAAKPASATSAAKSAGAARSGGPAAATRSGDRGRAAPAAGTASSPTQRQAAAPTRTAAAPAPSPRARETAVSSAGSGKAERAASTRGRESVPAGGATRARQGGGGGGGGRGR